MNEQEVLNILARALSNATGQKASGTPSTTAPIYGSGGLFGRCDGSSQLINSMVGPIGIEKVLEYIGTDTEREFVDTLTSIVETGSEQSTSCGDCVRVTNRACAQFYCFGRFCRQTEEHSFDDVGLRTTSSVPKKTLFGSITDSAGNVLVGSGETIDDVFYLQARSAGYALRYKHAQLLWSGNPANNAGSYSEFSGLQLIVNTGKFDAYTQLSCDGIDSFLMNFAFQNPQSAGTYAIQQWFRRMVGQLQRRASGANMDWNTATMYIVMSEDAWDCVARAYACQGLDLCAGTTTTQQVNQDADQALARYEQYQQRMMLPVYGREYPVILDSQIPQTTGQPNGVCSDIYFLTTQINGETVLFGQYQDFNRTYGRVRNEMVSLFGSDDIAITDNGRFALVRDNSRGCFDLQVYTKPRLVSLTPWLLGRIQNVCCNVLSDNYPDPVLQNTIYTPDGGRLTTPVPVLYGDCPETLS